MRQAPDRPGRVLFGAETRIISILRGIQAPGRQRLSRAETELTAPKPEDAAKVSAGTWTANIVYGPRGRIGWVDPPLGHRRCAKRLPWPEACKIDVRGRIGFGGTNGWDRWLC